jgi:hypothetical protein
MLLATTLLMLGPYNGKLRHLTPPGRKPSPQKLNGIQIVVKERVLINYNPAAMKGIQH